MRGRRKGSVSRTSIDHTVTEASVTTEAATRLTDEIAASDSVWVTPAAASFAVEAPVTHPARTVFFTCLLAAFAALVLLCVEMRVGLKELRIPFGYSGDAIHVLALVKGLYHGDWTWFNSRLGAPFGAEMRDFPLTMVTDMITMKIFSWFIPEPGLVANLYWMFSIALSAATAAYCLLRLQARRGVAISFGIIYALQPFIFARGIAHLSLLFHFVPLLATGAIELITGRIAPSLVSGEPLPNRLKAIFSSIPGYLYAACVLQGFSHTYNSFFACFAFAVAGVIAAILMRRWSPFLVTGVLVAIICIGTVITLLPSLVFWSQKGHALTYKQAMHSELYALKIRHLLTPIPDHPLLVVRKIAEKIETSGFPMEYENATSKLGTVGSLGLLFLLGYVIAVTAGLQQRNPLIGACAALTLATVLFATTGGFSSLFNVFVSPDIRAYNRVIVFIDFYCLAVVAFLLSRPLSRLRMKSTAHAAALVIGGAALTWAAVADEATSARYYTTYEGRRIMFEQDAAIVAAVERVMPGGMIMQLPFTDFPLDSGFHRMGIYDHGLPYLHSKTTKWSWGAMTVRDGAWHRDVSQQPLEKMLPVLIAAGFTGLWVDEFGYASDNSSPVAEIGRVLGAQPIRHPTGRIAFFDLRAYRPKVQSEIAPAAKEGPVLPSGPVPSKATKLKR